MPNRFIFDIKYNFLILIAKALSRTSATQILGNKQTTSINNICRNDPAELTLASFFLPESVKIEVLQKYCGAQNVDV